ncbi:hypothetical protein ACVIEO_007043 [Rhizobium leguminosarum]
MEERSSRSRSSPRAGRRFAADMYPELVHAIEGREHSKVDKAALLQVAAVVGPGCTPAIFIENILEGPGEIIGTAESAINILVPEHLARAHQ